MAYHKVILRTVPASANRLEFVQAVASILSVTPQVAEDMLANLPITLATKCPLPQALTMQQIFGELGGVVEIDPPGLINPLEIHSSSEPVPHVPWFRSWRAILAVLLIMGVALIGIVAGSYWILNHIKPDQSDSEHERKEVADSLAQNPRNADLLIRKAMVSLGAARLKMKQSNWKQFGTSGDIPYDGQDLLPVPEADTALQALLLAKTIAPANPEVYRWLAEVYLQKGLGPEAVEFAQQAIQLQDSNPLYHNLLGTAWLEADNVGKAEIAFHNAYKRSSQYLPTYRNLGSLLLFHQQDTVQGLEWLFQYLAREPGEDKDRYALRKEMAATAFALYNPAWEVLYTPYPSFSQYERARMELEQRLGDQDSPETQEALAKLFLSQRILDAALPILQKLTRTHKEREQAWKMLICVYAHKGVWDLVEKSIEQALEAGAQDPFFEKNRGVIQKYYRINFEKSEEAWERYRNQGGDSYRPMIDRELARRGSR